MEFGLYKTVLSFTYQNVGVTGVKSINALPFYGEYELEQWFLSMRQMATNKS